MSGTVFYIVLFISAGGAAWLASRAEHRRDARWVGVLAIIAFAVVFAAVAGQLASS
ncbi:hypothetical protein [Rhodococcus sp. 06-418-5]|uniref:hypothetical protein n=1 Tax=Rhodococcus sp. 06-418-5 TaxID=2022507 RepID=UPI0015C5F648|nr:hypothetical protein [Rhodococcus sp. 06-418-5]